MKKIKLIPAVLVVGSFVLAGCGETPQPTHTHTYAEAWSTNSTQHWHANTCEAECGQKLASALGNHVDENKDGKCDVCAKELTPAHVHTYSSDWSTDASKHWHAATCEHTDLKSDEGVHVDLNQDYKCDTCGYSLPEPQHQHTFSEKWSSNSEKHWHVATCGHDVKSNEGAHVSLDKDGLCDVCGYKMSDPIIDPAVTKIEIVTDLTRLVVGQEALIEVRVTTVGGASTDFDGSFDANAQVVGKEGNKLRVVGSKEGKAKLTVMSTADVTKVAQIEFDVIDLGFDPSFIDAGFEYSKTFPVEKVKEFLGEGEYEVVSPSEMLAGGAYVKVVAAAADQPACVAIAIDGSLAESYASDLGVAGFDRIYDTSSGTIEAVDPTGLYTVSFYNDVDEETYEGVAPTYIVFYKSADVWDSSKLTTDTSWNLERIVNEDEDDIALATSWISKVPFVALGEDYLIEVVYDDSMREYIIELLQMLGLIDETTTEEELEYILQECGYTGPEIYLSVSDYSVCKPFEGYDQVLLDAGYAHIQGEEEDGYQYDYYELNDGLISYTLSFGFMESGNTIYLQEGIANLQAFPIDEANAFISDVLGSENSIVAYEETEGASFQAVIGEDEMDILVDYVNLEDAAAYAEKLEELGFAVEYIPADEENYPTWVATKGKLVVEFYLEQYQDETTEEYLDEGPLYFFIYADPNKHEEQGIYLPESISTNLKMGSIALDPEIVKLDGANFVWSSSDETIATVDTDGVVTLLAVGEVDITITSDVEIPEVGGFYSATVKLVVAEKPDFALVLADLNDALAYYGGTEVLSTANLPEIDCAEYEGFDGFSYYGCYVIQGYEPEETNESYISKLEGLGFEVLEDEYGKYYETEEYEISFNLWPADEEGPACFQVCIYFKEVASEGATFDFSELSETSGSMNGFSFTTSIAGGQSAPAYNDGKLELRLYANNTITFTSEEPMTEIFFDANTCGESKATATFVSASTGSVSEVDGGFLWEGNATEVTLTVSGSGQIHINLIDINGGSGGGGGGGKSEFTSWPADQIAACLEGGTELVPPAAEGTSFTFEESDEYYNDCYVGVYGGNMDAYIDQLEKAGYSITDYTSSYGCVAAVSLDQTLEIDVYDYDSYFELDIYAREPEAPSIDEFPMSNVQGYLNEMGITTSFPAPTGTSFKDYGGGDYGYEVEIEGDVNAYLSALSAAGFDVDDSWADYGMYTCTKGDLEIDIYDYGDGFYSATYGEIWAYEE